MFTNRVRDLLAGIAIAAGVVGLGGAAGAQPKVRVLGIAMPTTPPNLVHIPPWVAQDAGIFARYGIEAKIFTFEGGPSALRALVGGRGEVQIAAPGVPPFIAAVARGGDFKAIATYATKHPVAMVVQQEIKRCEDLRGKKIGTPGGAGAYAEVMARAVMQTCGLTPRDVQYLNISTGSRVPALVTGQADAFVLHIDQIFEAVKAKPSLRILAYLSDVLPRGWYAAYVTTGDVMRTDPKLLQDAVSALVEANRFIYRNRDHAIAIGVKYTKFDPDIVARTYDEIAKRGVWPVNEGLHKTLVEAGLDTEAQLGTITPDIKPAYDQVVQLGFITAAMTKLGRWTGDPRWQ
ncbi:MAG: ABC transporter substrate-binding protein [Bacillati bacterium ANGP1]|uniref:ABC transporter substrate-binding protein n=1 Tax=Candidatus Segetimicrobium genomatis TaxID=2569760 RepID=A0A537JLY9_9BACT|nr:MAG: ABC transporter substrate-binding protein [Terrabacteria group bacterium ANGP1]